VEHRHGEGSEHRLALAGHGLGRKGNGDPAGAVTDGLWTV